VTPAGIGREEFWKGILEPVSRVRPFTKFGPEYGPLVAAHIDDFDIRRYVDRTTIPKAASRQTLFAIAGTALALKDANITRDELAAASTAIICGSAIMDFGGINNTIESVHRHGARGVLPRGIAALSAPSVINVTFGIAARTLSFQNACCAGLDAIGKAAAMVAEGEVDMAICGGTEAPLHRCPLLELRAAGLTPPTADMPERLDRPFDLWRTTGVVSEGACMLILEPESSPRKGYSYISGYAFCNDDDGDLCGGLATSIRLALADARLRPAEIELINAWGPSHRLIDAAEARAIALGLGPAYEDIPVLSIKGSIGTPFAAAPAIQVATAALSQEHSIIPPTVNWDRPDPACPLNLSNQLQSIPHDRTLINAHGIGGGNSNLILEKC